MKVLLHTIPKDDSLPHEPTSHTFTKETTIADDVLSSLVSDGHSRILKADDGGPMSLVDIAKVYVIPTLHKVMGDHSKVGCLIVMGDTRIAKIRLTNIGILNTKVSGHKDRVLNNYSMTLEDGLLASVLITAKHNYNK